MFVQAVESDILSLVELVQSVYRGTSSLKGWTSEALFLGGQRIDADMILQILMKKNSFIFIYRNEKKLKSCVHLEKMEKKAHLGMLSVATELQGQNMGQKMISFCESFARTEWQSQALQIEVLHPRLELISWYERRGFQKTGNTTPFPNNPRFGVPKIENLHFIEMIKSL